MIQKLKTNNANTQSLTWTLLRHMSLKTNGSVECGFLLHSLWCSPFREYHQVLDVHQSAMKKEGWVQVKLHSSHESLIFYSSLLKRLNFNTCICSSSAHDIRKTSSNKYKCDTLFLLYGYQPLSLPLFVPSSSSLFSLFLSFYFSKKSDLITFAPGWY